MVPTKNMKIYLVPTAPIRKYRRKLLSCIFIQSTYLEKCLMKYDRPGGCPNYGKVRIANGILDFGDRSECDKACLEK